jgi:pimeloyl-[acyl-carrier protein] methyl ester esterase
MGGQLFDDGRQCQRDLYVEVLMKPIFLLVHGWGFDATFWTPLQNTLEFDAIAWDLGFFGSPAQPPLPPGRPVVAVGHSFGMLWLLHHRPVAWRAVVSINGFSCFTRRESFVAGIAASSLSRMIYQCAETPLQGVTDFRMRCGISSPCPAAPDRIRLVDGLQALVTWDERPTPVQLALCGRTDPLIPSAMSEACFAEDCIAWHEGGHLLPLEDPAWCAGHLRRMVERLS